MRKAKRTSLEDDTSSKEDELVCLLAVRDRIGAEEAGLASKKTLRPEYMVEQMAADVRVNGRQWVV